MAPPVLARRRRATFLDRDGVLNRSFLRGGVPHPPAGLDELEVLPGAVRACRRLHESRFFVVVVTNQPDIARSTTTWEEVNALHRELLRRLPLDEIMVCPHDDRDACACRKPQPGMLLDAAATFDLDMGSSIMVGDRWRDIEAGRRAGCRTVLIDHGYEQERSVRADKVAPDITGAVNWILSSHAV